MRDLIRVRGIMAAALALLLAGAGPLTAVAAYCPNDGGAQAATGKGTIRVAPSAVVLPDAYEPDDTTATARPLEAVNVRTFHPIEDLSNDNDWFVFTVDATGTAMYLETFTPAEPGNCTDPWLSVYDAAGASDVATLPWDFDGRLRDSDDRMTWSLDAGMVFIAPHPGTYYVRATSDDFGMGQFGDYVLYAHEGMGRRIAGATRFDTAVQASQLFWNDASNAEGSGRHSVLTGIVIANGHSIPDAMTAGMLAAVTGSPLLLTDGPDSVTPETLDEIDRVASRAFYDGIDAAGLLPPIGGLPPSYPKLPLYVVGGTAVLSDDLAEDIASSPYLGVIKRLAGATRHGTAAAVMDEIMSMHMGTRTRVDAAIEVPPFTAFVAAGDSPVDVIVSGPVAGACCSPLLLTRTGSLPTETANWITDYGVARVIVVGGTGAVSEDVYTELSALVGGNIQRVGGGNRYQTAKMLVDWEISNCQHPVNTSRMILASGTSLADAMMAVPLSSAMGNAPLLITAPGELSPEVEDYMAEHPPFTETSYLLGGSGVVSEPVFSAWNLYGQPFPMDR